MGNHPGNNQKKTESLATGATLEKLKLIWSEKVSR